MSIWVEYFKKEDNRNNTHAQMKEQAHWEEPDPKDIHKRFFDYMKDAKHFAHRMFEDGFHVTIKTDGGSS